MDLSLSFKNSQSYRKDFYTITENMFEEERLF